MEPTIQFRLEEFEGPLDLLLALVQKNKMSLYDIKIVLLIDQYLDVVGTLGPGRLDNASAFISMAARLVQMKSAMLLPQSEETERAREELTGLLVEYSACKEVAGRLREMAEGVFIAARCPAQIRLDAAYRGTHGPKELAAALSGIQGRSEAKRPPRAEQFDELVTAPVVSVTGRAIHLLRGLKNGLIARLGQSFAACRSRGETVATFLALLELIRAGRVAIADDGAMRVRSHTERAKLKQSTKAGVADGT